MDKEFKWESAGYEYRSGEFLKASFGASNEHSAVFQVDTLENGKGVGVKVYQDMASWDDQRRPLLSFTHEGKYDEAKKAVENAVEYLSTVKGAVTLDHLEKHFEKLGLINESLSVNPQQRKG